MYIYQMTVLIPQSLQGSQSRSFYFETIRYRIPRERLPIFESNFSFLMSVRIPGFSRYLGMEILGPIEGDSSSLEIDVCTSSCLPGDDYLKEDTKYFLAYSIAKNVHSFNMTVRQLHVSESWNVKLWSSGFLIMRWGEDFLINKTDTRAVEPVTWITKLFPHSDFGICNDLPDLMAYICINRREALERVPTSTKYSLKELAEWGATNEAIRDEVDAYVWTKTLFPSRDQFRSSKKLSDMINGPSLSRDHPWSVHRRLEAAMKRGTITEVVSIIQAGKLPNPDRLKVFSFILGIDQGPVTVPSDCKPCSKGALDTRFKSLVTHQQCGWGHVLEKFSQRVVLHSRDDSLALLRQFLNVMDPPMLEVIDRTTFDLHAITSEIFACTSLRDEDLLNLWDVLLVSPPDTLIKVLVFVLMELRELIMQDVENLGNVLLCVGDLVENFPDLVRIALSESSLD